jgi:hypothetical protein
MDHCTIIKLIQRDNYTANAFLEATLAKDLTFKTTLHMTNICMILCLC